MICLLACSSAKDKPKVVAADDTDVFQLLVHHANSTNDSAELYMGTSRQIIFIKTLKNNLGHSLVRSLLVMHAISGCDTTSRAYGIGKVTVLSTYAVCSRAAYGFLSVKADIETLGEKALLVICGSGSTSSLTLNDAHFNSVRVPGKATSYKWCSCSTQSPNSPSSNMVWQRHTCRRMGSYWPSPHTSEGRPL